MWSTTGVLVHLRGAGRNDRAARLDRRCSAVVAEACRRSAPAPPVLATCREVALNQRPFSVFGVSLLQGRQGAFAMAERPCGSVRGQAIRLSFGAENSREPLNTIV